MVRIGGVARDSGFRLAVVPDQAILFGKEVGNKERGGAWLVERNDRRADSIIQALDSLIRAHRILELTPGGPEKSFREDAMNTPSIHLRIGYGTDGQATGKRWQAYYKAGAAPPSINTFVAACKDLGVSTMSSRPGQKVVPAEVARVLTNSEVAKIKITKTGDIYLNKRKVSLAELDVELRRLKAANGVVHYYRESPEKELEGKVTSVVEEVIQKIIDLKLPISLSEKDFQ